MRGTANQSAADPWMEDGSQSGFVMMALLAVILPLFLLVGASSATMTNRDQGLLRDVDLEKALLAADAGIDESIWRATNGVLVSGTSFTRAVSNDQSFTVEPLLLNTDGLDNDGDTLVDEADENVFRLTITGTYGTATRKIAAYLGPATLLPPLNSAVVTFDPTVSVVLKGNAEISGINEDMDGSTVGSGDVNGLTTVPPGTVDHLLSELTGKEVKNVVGTGPEPSVGLSATFDLTELVKQVKNSANLVLTSPLYTDYDFGDGPAGITNITYRQGDVKFAGDGQGAGILLVTGNLTITGHWRFDGVIIVLGSIDNSAGTADVYGAVIQGPNGGLINGKGHLQIQYSSEAIDLATQGSGGYISLNGWQEISLF